MVCKSAKEFDEIMDYMAEKVSKDLIYSTKSVMFNKLFITQNLKQTAIKIIAKQDEEAMKVLVKKLLPILIKKGF